jgi:hypothetical protein
VTNRKKDPKRIPNCSLDPRDVPSPAWPHRIRVGPPRGLLIKLYLDPEPVSRDHMPWVDDPRFGLKDD